MDIKKNGNGKEYSLGRLEYEGKFLNGESEDIEFDSIRQAKELFIQCRIIFQKEYNGTQTRNRIPPGKGHLPLQEQQQDPRR